MKEVSIFVYDLNLGGTEKVMVNLANFLSENDCHVTIVMVGSNKYLQKELFPQISVIGFNKQRISSSFWDLCKYIRSHRIDFFVSNVWPLTIFTILAGLLKRGFCKKVILVEHCHLEREFSSFSLIFKFLQRASIFLLYRLAYKVVAVSDGVKEDLCINKGVSQDKVMVIHNPVDISFSNLNYDNREIQDWRDFPEAKLISVGNLKVQKNYPYLLDALSILRDQGFKFKQLILGEGLQRDLLTKKILSLDLEDNVCLVGSVDQPINLIRDADTFILSSKFEGFGLVIVEALAAGTMVVSTNCESGPAEILQDGNYGLLAPTNSAEKFAEAIHRGYTNQIRPDKLTRRAQQYTIEVTGPKYLELINKI